MKRTVSFLLISIGMFFPCSKSVAQINGYAKVTAIAGTALSVNNVNETFDSFEAGEQLVIMQMQGADIGSNTADNASFGTLSNIQNAGVYEIRTIASVTESAGVPTTITLSAAPSNTYTIAGNVQVITFPKFGSGGNYTTTANITGVAWNGNVGGVVAFQVDKYLTLAHNISADAIGFQGGARGGDDGGGCISTTFISSVNAAYGNKGQGIYVNTTAGYAAARGKIVNGGGGASRHNGGGAGGGNYTAGGDGGVGWNPSCGSQGGIGGEGLSAYISTSRMFMGGGGGGGQTNNNVGSGGATGGGIIILKADSLIVTGTCGGRSITANGGTANNGNNDGQGGGGAGGSIYLNVGGIRVVSACPLTISANGGNGGTVNNGGQHGAGGGGGQGVVFVTATGPFSNTSISTNNGSGGCNTNAVPCTNQANSGAGSANSGIFYNLAAGPLPVELLFFNAYKQNHQVTIQWATATEQNCSHFVVYRSADGVSWLPIAHKNGAGNSAVRVDYVDYDQQPLPGINYYVLEQFDFDGTRTVSPIIAVDFSAEGENKIALFPNPGNSEVFVQMQDKGDDVALFCADISGRKIALEFTRQNANMIRFSVDHLENGHYFLLLVSGGKVNTIPFLVNHGN